jgi:hypothetical protein
MGQPRRREVHDQPLGVTELEEADAEAQVQQRVGALLSGGEDHWWALDADTDTAALAPELEPYWRSDCLPPGCTRGAATS